MAKQNVNVGLSANDGTGDTLRDGAIKVNNVIIIISYSCNLSIEITPIEHRKNSIGRHIAGGGHVQSLLTI